MQNPDESNAEFKIAADLIKFSNKNIFLTGKAGTGKTTFLHYIRAHCRKNLAVIAPTGVAAINAGGVTMHSFFQLPFEPFVPVKKSFSVNMGVSDKHSLFNKIKLNTQKREVIEALELLIIDEVSMLRCDKLDSIDTILRAIRKKNIPFGGVQVLFIGDMYQLPPVAPDNDWQILREHYKSPFFFDAQVIHEIELVHVELLKIYRQKQQIFIDLLNNVRNNNVTEFDFELLQERYRPVFSEEEMEHAITITTHNYKADKINIEELQKLSTEEHVFIGKIEGDFSEKSLPTELKLTLKEGAQIMFIKNDTGEDRAFYNGKIATVKSIAKNKITVTMQDDGSEFEVKKHNWENIKYVLNKQKNIVEEEELGRFTQYPIRLAWAITIHKSQGLTFENIIIDAGQSFAPGQVYVALSRCTTLEGMILLSRINPHVISTDERIIAFSKQTTPLNRLENLLENETKLERDKNVLQAFEFGHLIKHMEGYVFWVSAKNFPDIKGAAVTANYLMQKVKQQYVLAEQYKSEIEIVLDVDMVNLIQLEEVITRHIYTLADKLSGELIKPLQEHIATLDNSVKMRKYIGITKTILTSFELQLKTLCSLQYGELQFIKADEAQTKYQI